MSIRTRCIFYLKQGANPIDAWKRAVEDCAPVIQNRAEIAKTSVEFPTQAIARNVDSLLWEPETWGKARVYHNVKGITEQQGYSKSRHRHLKFKAPLEGLGSFTGHRTVELGSFPRSCTTRVLNAS